MDNFNEGFRAGIQHAIKVATGCVDYGGGYRSNPELLDAYHHGMATVGRVLEKFVEASEADDFQAQVIARSGETDWDLARITEVIKRWDEDAAKAAEYDKIREMLEHSKYRNLPLHAAVSHWVTDLVKQRDKLLNR